MKSCKLSRALKHVERYYIVRVGRRHDAANPTDISGDARGIAIVSGGEMVTIV